MIDYDYALLLLGAGVGATIQAATGFGFAIVAAPVFLAVMNSHQALQVLVIVHLVQSAMMLREAWTLVPQRLLRALILGAALGSPIGLAAFMSLDVRTLKLAVGILIVLFTGLLIARELGFLGRRSGAENVDGRPVETPRPLTYVAGGVSGAMTSLFVMPGPALMLYLASAPLPHVQARALAIVFFAFCYLFVTVLNGVTTGLSAEVWLMALGLVLPVGIGTLVGRQIARRVTQQSFRIAVLALLVLSGAGAILSAL